MKYGGLGFSPNLYINTHGTHTHNTQHTHMLYSTHTRMHGPKGLICKGSSSSGPKALSPYGLGFWVGLKGSGLRPVALGNGLKAWGVLRNGPRALEIETA